MEQPIYGADRLGTFFVQGSVRRYELKDHLGNVRGLLLRNKNGINADIYSFKDYYAFGSKAQSGGTDDYRYDYQGQYSEKEKENGLDWNAFDLRMYDAKIGRWLSVDPKGQYWSPYVGMGNNPMNGVDPDGGFWQELGNWLFSSEHLWVSNTGLEYYRNNPGSSYEWEGDRLTGMARLSSMDYTFQDYKTSTLPGVNVALFKAVQDYTFAGVDVYFDLEWKVTGGFRSSMLLKNFEGFDVNMLSVDLAKFSFVDNKMSVIGIDGFLGGSVGYELAHAGATVGIEASFVGSRDLATNKVKIEEALMKINGGYAGIGIEGAIDLAQKRLSGAIAYGVKGGTGLVTEITPKLVVKQHTPFHW